MMNTIKKKTVIFTVFLFILHWQALSHLPGGGTGGGAFGGSGAGRSFAGVSVYSANDSAKVAFDLYNNFSYSLCSDLNEGEPLGTGGLISKAYNAFLFQEYTTISPYPYRNDYRQQQLDFGYVPLWQANTISGRLQYRFLPNLWGMVTMDCNLDGVVANIQNATSYLRFGALNVKWAPKALKDFSMTLGKVHIAGTFIPLFDQMPLENFLFNGLIMDYFRSFKNTYFLSGRVAAGQQFIGRTVSFDSTTGYRMYLFQNLGKSRNRNHIFAKAQFGYKRKFGIKLVGGYQTVPADSTQYSYGGSTQPLVRTLYLPKTTGWHIGTELAFNTKKTNHIGICAYGKDDVLLGWGSPYCVNKPDDGGLTEWFQGDSLMPDFSMMGSALFHGVYWVNVNLKKLMIDFGLSGFWQQPSKHKVTYTFNNHYWFTTPDNIVILILKEDTSTIQAQDFKALKGALNASYRVAKYLRLGFRYDEIHFFNPDAHSNIPELGYLRADVQDTTAKTLRYLYDNPARWEREAVNARIVTPFLSLEVINMLRIRAAYAFAFYDHPVYRQSRLSRRHGNFSLGATLTCRFAKLPEE